MKKNPYRTFILVAAWITGIAAFVAVNGLCTSLFIPDIKEIMLYVGISGSGLAFLGFVALIIAISVSYRVKNREENDLCRDLHLVASGERKLIQEQGVFYKRIRHEVNKAHLSKYQELPYGVYEEDQFDDVVLNTLNEKITSLAGLVYFELVAPLPIKTKGPVEALLTMAKGHFGEQAYYGKRDNGIAVFVPYLGSQEEMMGKARKVVQLYSYSEEENHINVKAGIAFYPELSPRNMTSAALKATLVATPMEQEKGETEVPLVGYKAAESVSIILAGKLLNSKLAKPITRAEASKAFKEFSDVAMSSLGVDVIDVFSFDEARGGFLIEEEASKGEASGFASLMKDGLIPEGTLGPIYEWSIREKGAVSASKTVYLPESMKARLENLGMHSVAAMAIEIDHHRVGLLLLGSADNDLVLNYDVQRYFAFAERYLYALTTIKSSSIRSARVDAMLGSFEHYAYAIQSDSYSLSYISPNLSRAIPNAKVGIPCYEALFGLKKPCKDCPLFRVGVEKVMPTLSSGVFAFRALPGENETIMVLSPHQADFTSSRLDELTGLLSDASLHEDLQNEILLKENQGQVLGFRIRNADSLRGGLRLSSTDEIIKIASQALISARLARGVYRNGDDGFAYLLPFASKKEAIDLAENVSKVLTARIPFRDKHIELYLDFVLVSYPLEAFDTFTLDSLFRVLYGKANASSRGKLFEVNHPEGRMVDHNYYAKVKLEEALRAGVLPVEYKAVEQLAGNRIAYLEAVSALRDEDDQIIEEERVVDMAESIEKGSEMRVAMVRNIVKYLAKAPQNGPRGVILRIHKSCFKNEFLKQVDELFARDKLDRKCLIFQVEEEDAKEEAFHEFASQCKRLGYRLGLGSYKADLNVEQLKGYLYVNVPAPYAYGAKKEAYLAGLSSVRELGLNVIVSDVTSKEARHYLASLSFHYGVMKDAKRIPASELIQ